jgi:nucleotide-binding universal stress UspA family protein
MNQDEAHHRAGVVVIGVDGTEEADRAIRYGVAEAVRENRSVRLVHVVHESVPLTPMLPMFGTDTLRAVGTRILAEAEQRARDVAEVPIRVEQVLAHGPRAGAILQHAEDAALVVLGTRSSTMQRLWTGSTTTGVAARAHCPVVAVPVEWLTAVEHRRVIAGVDGSPASAQVIEAAFAEARARQAGLVVLHAWRPTGQYDAVIGERVGAETWARQTEPAVWALVAGWRADYPQVDVQVVLRYQNVAMALAEASRQADLLVIGRRGERAPFGLALGSRARTMLRVAACPVEIVPVPRTERSEFPRQAAGRIAGEPGRAATRSSTAW